jgi:hypothetical protein
MIANLKSALVVAIALVASLPAQAQPSKGTDCRAYGALAALNAGTMDSAKCGMSGPRWSTSAAEHEAWCNRVSDLERGVEDGARRVAYECCGYAVRAAALVLVVRQNKCEVSGPRWSPDIQSHLNWCISAARGYAKEEENARRTECRRRCAGSLGGTSFGSANFCDGSGGLKPLPGRL